VFNIIVACCNQFTSLLDVGIDYTLLNNLASVFVNSELLEVLQCNLINLLLSLCWV